MPVTYIAHFQPEAWVGDTAIPIDPPTGETCEWDATEAFLQLDPGYKDAIIDALDHEDDCTIDYDDRLRGDSEAPEWVHKHSGPFTLRITRHTPKAHRYLRLRATAVAVNEVLDSDDSSALESLVAELDQDSDRRDLLERLTVTLDAHTDTLIVHIPIIHGSIDQPDPDLLARALIDNIGDDWFSPDEGDALYIPETGHGVSAFWSATATRLTQEG